MANTGTNATLSTKRYFRYSNMVGYRHIGVTLHQRGQQTAYHILMQFKFAVFSESQIGLGFVNLLSRPYNLMFHLQKFIRYQRRTTQAIQHQ